MEPAAGAGPDPAGPLQAEVPVAEILYVTRSLRPALAARLVTGLLTAVLAAAAPAQAQTADVTAAARTAATTGHRPDAIKMLETHLAAYPRDVDARLLLGVILSWDGKYEQASSELTQVLDQSPTYNDARVALANVAWWTGRYDQLEELAATGRRQRPYDTEWMMQQARALDGQGRHRAARDLLVTLLARQPGHVHARALKTRLDAQLRPWAVTAGYGVDRFSDQRTPWNEYSLSVSRLTPVGSVIGRVSRASRFGLNDTLYEVEAYPTLRPGTNAYVSFGMSKDDMLFPNYRAGADLYQSLGHGYEASIGMRRLGFTSTTDIYVGTLTKYVGNWMLTGKVFTVPDYNGPQDSVSYHAVTRRYVKGDGESFWGLGYSRGFSREEVGDSAELLLLNADTFRGATEILFGRRNVVALSVSSSRQERAGRSTLWQHSAGASFTVRF